MIRYIIQIFCGKTFVPDRNFNTIHPRFNLVRIILLFASFLILIVNLTFF